MIDAVVDGRTIKVPGKVLAGLLELRKRTGTLPKKKKEKVRFLIRSAEDLIDIIRAHANELGLLIYAGDKSSGVAHPLESGTLAHINLHVIVQSVEDGSQLEFFGFGVGADDMDKAGGKAMTYAFKAALIVALLAGGADNAKALGVVDTDDTDTPIKGGPKRLMQGSTKPSVKGVETAMDKAETPSQFKDAFALAMKLPPEDQLALKEKILATKARVQNVSDK